MWRLPAKYAKKRSSQAANLAPGLSPETVDAASHRASTSSV
jgi:hypothetical protein